MTQDLKLELRGVRKKAVAGGRFDLHCEDLAVVPAIGWRCGAERLQEPRFSGVGGPGTLGYVPRCGSTGFQDVR